jgi:hypothetical protein
MERVGDDLSELSVVFDDQDGGGWHNFLFVVDGSASGEATVQDIRHYRIFGACRLLRAEEVSDDNGEG